MLSIFVARRPGVFAAPCFWAEDGTVFFREQLESGLGGSLLAPHAGYVHVLPRLLAGAAALLPIRYAPLAYALLSTATAATCCTWFARAEFRRWLPEDSLRAVACLWLAAAPTGGECQGSLANLQWYLFWLALLLALAPLPRSRAGSFGFSLAWVVIGLSTPAAVALVPLLVLRSFVTTTRAERALAIFAATPSVAFVGLALAAGPSFSHTTGLAGAVLAKGLLRLVGCRVIAEPFVGADDVLGLALRTRDGAAVACAFVFVVSFATLVQRGGARGRAWLAFSFGSCALYLLVLLAARPRLLETAARFRTAWGSDRYFLVPSAIVVTTHLMAVASAARPAKLLLVPALSVLLASALAGFRLEPRLDSRWPEHAAAIERALATQEDCVLDVPIAPRGWSVKLRLVRGRAVRESP